jgi:dethiobiotin synthetase
VTVLRLVLVGTGTGVGKTHVGCALIEAGAALGVETVGLKPIETGVAVAAATASDQDRLEQAARGFHVKRGCATFHVKRSPYQFADPISPHLAARKAGVRIDLAVVVNWVRDHSAPFIVVETAGGLFSPLADNVTNLDLVTALGPAVALLVAPDRLGVLHDVSATRGLAAARGFPIRAVVLSAPEAPDASTGQNAPELTRLGIAQPLAVFPRAPPSDSRSIAAATAVLQWAQQPIQLGS